MTQPEKPTRRAYLPEDLTGANVMISISALGSVRRAEIRDIANNCIITNVVAVRLTGDRRADADGKFALELVLGTPESFTDQLTDIKCATISTQVSQAERHHSAESVIR